MRPPKWFFGRRSAHNSRRPGSGIHSRVPGRTTTPVPGRPSLTSPNPIALASVRLPLTNYPRFKVVVKDPNTPKYQLSLPLSPSLTYDCGSLSESCRADVPTPELWDQKNKLYSTREAKLIAWAEVGDEMGVSGDAAKIKWTSLRDVFRREIKRTLRTSIGHDGISQVRSKWVHFNSMLFLKDQMSIDTQSGANFSQNYIDGDTIKVEDADSVSNFPDGGSLSYVDVGDLGAMTSTSPSYPIQPPRRRKRRLTENEPEGDNSETGKQREWFSNGGQVVEDEDYHFLMSVLPSVRQVAPGRKTSFRMKVLELIREEESFVLSKRTSFDEYRGGSDDNQAQ
uniref:MADF domain-containing protein n=1 Tax=Timema tahoe TaxID=61484 RepID=A0A7R9NVM4_9NEOP|nr:unnamed protein product [Timema tahoe]